MIPPLASESLTADGLRWTFAVPVDHPLFEGHFPGHPILPGVVALGWMLAAAERFLGRNLAGGRSAQREIPGRHPARHPSWNSCITPKPGGRLQGIVRSEAGVHASALIPGEDQRKFVCRAPPAGCGGPKPLSRRMKNFVPAVFLALLGALAGARRPSSTRTPPPAAPATVFAPANQLSPGRPLPFTLRQVFHRLEHDRTEIIPFTEVRTFKPFPRIRCARPACCAPARNTA